MKRLHSLIVILLSTLGFSYQVFADDYVFSKKIDLNNDGKLELIQLRPSLGNPSHFQLQVNTKIISGELSDEVQGFKIIDINKSDDYKEIAVYTPGPSSDDEYLIYGFNGTSLYEVGHLSRWPTFQGNGIVLVDSWRNFWPLREKYVLSGQHQLVMIPQDAYAVGVSARVEESFPIYRSPTDIDVIANLAQGSQIDLLVFRYDEEFEGPYSDDGWYMIKSSTKLIGWAKESVILAKLSELPLAD